MELPSDLFLGHINGPELVEVHYVLELECLEHGGEGDDRAKIIA